MKLKVYAYANCGTCRNALQWLNARGIPYETVAIRETPPAPKEIKRMLRAYGGDVRRLFNTSGGDYKAMNLKATLPTMSESDAVALLAAHGNLVKRPFVLGKDVALVGFQEAAWEAALG